MYTSILNTPTFGNTLLYNRNTLKQTVLRRSVSWYRKSRSWPTANRLATQEMVKVSDVWAVQIGTEHSFITPFPSANSTRDLGSLAARDSLQHDRTPPKAKGYRPKASSLAFLEALTIVQIAVNTIAAEMIVPALTGPFVAHQTMAYPRAPESSA